MNNPNDVRYTVEQQIENMDARMKRIETRLCRLMIALDIDPNRGPDEPVNAPQPYSQRAEPPKDYAPDAASRPRRLLAVLAGRH